ncbi:2-hydroxyacid dehydrogenase [Ammoniphilus resinae]|uniref:D-3-phosphoglycerate dehydrogenase n=1 Tax=Ammoniphilus resinae TaxID=861532 RepID=A0ABS4GWU0_9BACL|nr:2-hydroxyacid dehydrogenase [Ammoniphilus resinae]MBP1934572.1 D-3-phosphoglycerate dehydrogenase [Ammoniphilus resinae]
MKAFVTAQLTEQGINELSQSLSLEFGGWGYEGVKLTPEQLVERAKDCEILIVGYEDITEDVLRGLPRLQYIACTRGGIENIDVELVKCYHITLSNTPGRNASAVADLTMGLMIGISRFIPQTYRYIMERRWGDVPWDIAGNTPYKRFAGPELEQKTVGLIGYGAIGRKVAKRAKGFDMNVIVYDPYLKEANEDIFVASTLEEVLTTSDFISLHCKLSSETKNIICKETLNKMKAGAYLINSARGGLVNEEDLFQALLNKRIAGAALDVLVEEPMDPNHPFLQLENIILTPHIGGASQDILYHQTEMVVKDVQHFVQGKRPLHALT